MTLSTCLGSQELRNPSSCPLFHSPKSNPINAAGCNLRDSSSVLELSGTVMFSLLTFWPSYFKLSLLYKWRSIYNSQINRTKAQVLIWPCYHRYCWRVSMLPGNFASSQWCFSRVVWVLAWRIMTPTRQHGRKHPVWGLREEEESQMDGSCAMSSCSSIFKMLSFCPILIKPQNQCLHLEAPCLGLHTALVRELVTRILPTTFYEELSLLRSLKYLKIYMLPLLTQPFVLLPWVSPTTMLLCLLAIFYYSTTWGYKPHRTQGMVPHRAGEMPLQDCLRNPLAYEKKGVKLWSTSTVVP